MVATEVVGVGVVRAACEQVKALLDTLDPACLSPRQAVRLVEDCAELEHLAVAGRTLAAGRAAHTGAWIGDGTHPNAEAWIAAVSGTTVGQAKATLETAARLGALPATGAAFRAGTLSAVQVDAIAAAATTDPDAEPALLHSATINGVKGLRDDCARVRAAACRDEAERHERARRDRSVHHYRDADGAGRIDIKGPLEHTSLVMAALEPIERQLFERARRAGRRERPDAIAFDALCIATGATPAPHDGDQGAGTKAGPDTTRRHERRRGPAATIVVHVSHTAFVRGQTEPGEICEIAGVGPIPVTVARQLSEDAFLKALITNGTDILAVAHLGRSAIPAHLRTAIEARDRECVVAGCHVARHLEIDHNTPVTAGGPTSHDNLNRLCRAHHLLKTLHDARLVGPRGAMTLQYPPGRGPTGPDPPFPSEHEARADRPDLRRGAAPRRAAARRPRAPRAATR